MTTGECLLQTTSSDKFTLLHSFGLGSTTTGKAKLWRPARQGPLRLQELSSPFLRQRGDLENHQAMAEESEENGEAFGSKGLWDSKAAA